MILPDVNVLIYAFRPDAPLHDLCRLWLAKVITSETPFGLSRLALSAVIRVTTNARIFKQPSELADAFGFCRDLMDQPHCQLIEPGERHWSIFETLCRQTKMRGPGITDAWFAALTIELGCEWITFDHDFSRFDGIKSSKPRA